MTETVLKIKSVFDPKGAEDARSNLTKLKQALGGLNGIGSKANGIFSNFLSSLTRIAKLRLLRGIIRSITGAFKEGTENIYRYSQALGSADASHFASTMDSLASSMLYMKNSIGAIVAPLLTSLLPAIQSVVNWFVTATQAVAQFFSALGGQVTYTKAKEYATSWKDVGNAIGGASASAKEYKNTIMSFDELHVLNDVPEGGGGGGGAGSPGLDYSNMFEEAVISKKIRDLVQWLKDNFEDIKDIAISIGGILLGWKIADGVAGFMTALGFANGEAIREFGLGIALTITGITLSAKGGYDIGYEGVDLMNIIKTALGIGLAGAGGAMVAHAITALGWATVGTGVGALFGIGIALVGTIIGFTLGEGAKQRDDIKANLEEYVGQIDMILNRQNGYLAVSEQAWDAYDAKVANLRFAEDITNQLVDMQHQGEYTSAEIDVIKTLIDELNGLGLEGITAQWNEETQQIEINSQAIYDNIQALEEQYKKEAYKEIYIQALKDQADAMLEVKSAQRLVQQAQDDYNAKLSTYQNIADALGISLEELAQQHGFEDTMLAKEAYERSLANQVLDKATQKYDEATGAIEDCREALGYYTQDIKETSSATKDATNSTNEYADAVNNLDNAGYDGSNVTGGMSNVAWWADNVASKIKNAKDEMNRLNDAIIYTPSTVSITVGKIGAYAKSKGGFVQNFASGGIKDINSADIFLANENGNAEMIGRIGNRTAVGTQQQMTDSIAEGIYRAMSDVMSQGNSNTEVNVYMNDEVVARATDRGNRSLNRRFNVSLA